ncbi:MAG: hypothetical protein HXX11_00475 [Desulfuromonadales bacterium]|nr:hypothetical protein [Desulfuromonadales bacterium]
MMACFLGSSALAMTTETAADRTVAPLNSSATDVAAAGGNFSALVPLAGEAYQTTIMGRRIAIPARNRDNVLALTLGATAYTPKLGGDSVLPIAALYWKQRWDSWWTRDVIALFVNEMDVAKSYGRFQLLGHLENNTVPSADVNIKDGREVTSSSVIWGTVSGWLGAGYRMPVAPWQADNDLRVQLFYHAGYFYDARTGDTGSTVHLPPDTYQHGLRLRVRYDGLLRNIMELPHQGVAWGGDLELTRRDTWSDSTFGGLLFTSGDTRDYLKFSGYVIGAMGIPGLSERHRFVGYLHGGVSPMGKLDRFSSFRAGGGPFPNESDDLYRLPYPGALFNNFGVTDYVVGTLEYRLQLAFFLYLHLRGSFAWGGNRPDYDTTKGLRLRLTSSDGEAFSVGLTSGFIADSQLYLEYSYDSKLLRNGRDGSSVMLLWSKSF